MGTGELRLVNTHYLRGMLSENIVTAESVFIMDPTFNEQELVSENSQRKLETNGLEPTLTMHMINAKDIQEAEDKATTNSNDCPMAPFLS